MSEEVKTQPEATTEASTEKPQETTLEEVYKTYNVEETAEEFRAAPQKQQQQQVETRTEAREVAVPDPTVDLQGHKAFTAAHVKDQQALRQALHQVAGKLTNMERAAARQAEEADIKRAVESVNQHLGDSKLDPDVVEISLGAEARKDQRFMALWNARHKNPKAFNEGIKAFSNKLAKKFSMRSDPQIAENQRALKEATSTKATTASEESETEKIGKLTGSAFDRALDKFRPHQ